MSDQPTKEQLPEFERLFKSLETTVGKVPAIPDFVRTSVTDTLKVGKRNREQQRERNAKLITSVQTANTVITDAERKIDASEGNLFGSLLGLVLDDYDTDLQERRIVESGRNIQTQKTVSDIKTAQENLNLQDAAAPFKVYSKVQDARAKNLAFSQGLLGLSNNSLGLSLQQLSIDAAEDQKTLRKQRITSGALGIEAQKNALDQNDLDVNIKKQGLKNSVLSAAQITENIKSGKLQYSMAQLSYLSQSRSAQRTFNDGIFAEATVKDLKERKATNNFDSIFTEQKINNYIAKEAEVIRNAELGQLALKSSRLGLAATQKKFMLKEAPKAYLTQQYKLAIKSGTGFVDLGAGFPATLTETLTEIQRKDTVFQKELDKQTGYAIKLSANNSDFNTAQRTLGITSQQFFESPVTSEMFSAALPNVDEKFLSTVKFDEIDPRAASEWLAVIQHTVQMNDSGTATPGDLQKQSFLQGKLNKKLDVIKKEIIARQPTDELKTAQADWLSSGKITSAESAANVVVSNLSIQPRLKNKHEERAWVQMSANIVEILSGKKLEIYTPEEGINQEALLESSLNEIIKKKRPSPQIIAEAMAMENEKKQTPLSIFANSFSKDVMVEAVTELVKDYPKMGLQLFGVDNTPQPLWVDNFQNLSLILAKTAFNMQLKDETRNDNFLNRELNMKLTSIYQAREKEWAQQTSLEQGSFSLSLLQGRKVADSVDKALEMRWGRHFGDSWSITKQEFADKTGN